MCGANGGGTPRRVRRKNLLFDGACRHPVDHILHEAEVEDDDGHRNEDGACGKARKFRLVEVHEPHGDRPVVHRGQQKLRKDEVRPRPGEGRERRIDEDGFGKGQDDLSEYLKVGRPVQPRRLIDGGRNGVKEPFLHHVAHRCLRGVDEDEPPMVVDEIELRHEEKYRRHCHEGREHPQNERRFHERFAALEFEARHTVRRQDGEERPEQAAQDRHEQGVSEPFGVVIHLRIGEQILIVAEAERFGEKPFECISDKPGVYQWWASKSDLLFILQALGMQFPNVQNDLEEQDGYYCIYVGIAWRESLRSRLNWHINQKNTISSVKSKFLSTLRQSIAAVLGVPMTDTDAVNDFMDRLQVSYGEMDFAIRSQDAKQAAHGWERNKFNSGKLYILNIQGNRTHPQSPCKKLRELRAIARQKALNG